MLTLIHDFHLKAVLNDKLKNSENLSGGANKLPPGGLNCFIHFVFADFVKDVVNIADDLG